MKIKGRGQAKILSLEERERFFSEGFLCARDRALNAICCYTACRISEARQLQYKDVFHADKARDIIVFGKNITKGKRATRQIPMHSRLAEFLEQYQQESLELLSIKKKVRQWDYKSLSCPSILSPDGKIICPKCESTLVTTAGQSRGIKMYKCKACLHRFQEKTAFTEYPELKDRITKLGVFNSTSYGFLFLNPQNPYLFPGSGGNGCMSLTTAKEIFSAARERTAIEGSATHSWRRTALTNMSADKVPLRTMQKVSGHERLSNLQKYVEVTREQMAAAINQLPFFQVQNEEQIP
ncbi:MAG: site-specific integrase [Myxacorys chilensis ATA2-1-KO14]|jgi:site-specific recombinase XerD|nr:site-specific integrase [Myxacorys chilensis ATA2-1-KO14]